MTQQIFSRSSNRRNFLKGAGLAGIGLAATAVTADKFGTGEQTVHASSYSDSEILNFALNLEYLEAEFYAVSTYGANLVTLGIISKDDESGPTTGGHMVPNFGSADSAYLASALRMDEIDHVKLLRSALGSAAVKKPAINLDALGYGFGSVHDWLKLARQFEEVGMSAYLGAAPLINSSQYLAAAAAILEVESQHTGALRAVCVMNGVYSPPVDSLDLAPSSKQPFHDKNGLGVPRTPAQVLNVVYHGGNCSGGFYPDGMNGTIVCRS